MSSRTESSSRKNLRIARYILKETLGVGTFGKVKRAEHELTGHKVAIKILNRHKISSLDVAEKIKREIQILKLFRHPHIIKLYEVITTPTDIFMIMEYVSGGELFDYIVKHGKSTEEEARKFFQQIISGVDYCHRHKVVHRDLKPENLLLDSNNEVKIADFGLSNMMKDGEFLRTSCGSPNYAAPEVVSGKLYAGPEVDVWSCGIILYALLCGTLPFEDPNISMLFRKIKNGQFFIPSHLSKGAVDLLTQMLQVNPVRRMTIQQIRDHTWFRQDLPKYLFPLPGDQDYKQIDTNVLSEVCQKLSVNSEEVLTALRSGDCNHHLAIAYELVRDNRVILSQAESSLGPEYATSPPSSGFSMKEAMYAAGIEGSDSSVSPGKTSTTPVSRHLSHSLSSGSSMAIKLPRTYKRPKWHLGIRSQSHPQNIMQEIMRKLQGLNFQWKMVNPFFLRCRYDHPTLGFVVKIDLQLYQIDQRNYLLDFKSVEPPGMRDDELGGEDSSKESSPERGDPAATSGGAKRHYTMEFFEACSSLISALAQ